jgi:hypothetical protein
VSVRVLRLGAVASAAGAASGLFGIGGGTVVVPLLILWLGFGERSATGTSLAAVLIMALFAVAAHGAYGNVDISEGALLGVPAVGGVIAGTTLQQRLPERAVSLIFAALLLATAIELIAT